MLMSDKDYRMLLKENAIDMLDMHRGQISKDTYETVKEWFHAFSSFYTDEMHTVNSKDNLHSVILQVLYEMRCNFESGYSQNLKALGKLESIHKIVRWKERRSIDRILKETAQLIARNSN